MLELLFVGGSFEVLQQLFIGGSFEVLQLTTAVH